MSTLTKREYPSTGISLANFFPNLESWAVGFDRPMRLLDEMSSALMGRNTSFPPYNIKQLNDDKYQIEMAVAGFGKPDLKIELANNQLTVEGSQSSADKSSNENYLYKGIAARQFRQSFALEDHVKVLGYDTCHKAQTRGVLLNITRAPGGVAGAQNKAQLRIVFAGKKIKFTRPGDLFPHFRKVGCAVDGVGKDLRLHDEFGILDVVKRA